MLRILPIFILAVMTAWSSASPAATSLDLAYLQHPNIGPRHARGVVIYSHGRSLVGEDALSPSPAYLEYLARAGWDTMRFNRPSREDSLDVSAADLAQRVDGLRRDGYQQIVLAGQSFGAFLSIMAAARSGNVDAIIGTSPAAFGSRLDSLDTWHLNASQLYAHLARVRSARVLLAFFDEDPYDPGNRGPRSRAVLGARGLDTVIIDRPSDLTGHLAGQTGRFVTRYGSCLLGFIEGQRDPGCGRGIETAEMHQAPN